ncbi:MAG TPA: hypothetical protein VHJ38_18350 [Nitrososphaeraceae archaeon]|jgi:hypothetical protein|nr:hypothetical protein [Nitrososphaeraceae archaeon]
MIANEVSETIRICRNEEEVDRKMDLLISIINYLSIWNNIKINSLITKDYINFVLDQIEYKFVKNNR